MGQFIASITLLVPDYDQAIAHYCDGMGFTLVQDTRLSDNKRWVVVTPDKTGTAEMGEQSLRLILALPTTPAQHRAMGNQAGDRIFLFLQTDQFWADYRRMQTLAGIEFLEAAPRTEPYGTVIQFRDAFGTLWDLIQPAAP